jgi:plastocyanin
MDALWHSILDLLSKVIIPDWGELITLLPLGLAGLVILWFAFTIRRFATLGPARRAPARLTPIAPAGIHMPGPSYAPILAAAGTAALLWGTVVGGNALLVGALALVLTLLYWGREAIRDYDHEKQARTLPAVVYAGPPPGVHMPGPSFRPLLGAIGTTALMAGLVVGGWVLAAGTIILVATLVGWLVDARAEYVKTVEADRTGHLENIPAPGWPRRLLQGAAVIFVVAALVQTGVIPPKDSDTAVGPGASPAPSGPASSGLPGPSVEPGTIIIVASKIAFDTLAIEVAAGQPFSIYFDNQDPLGVVHDVDIRASDKTTVIKDQPVVNGGETVTYTYDPLPAGQYVFICSIHPIPGMTGTLTVK